MRKALSAVVALLLFTLVAAAPVAAQDDAESAHVTIVHGIPGQTVDVFANEDPLIAGLTPQTTTETVSLDADEYEISLYSAGADIAEDEPLVAETVTLDEGTNVTVAAHLDEDAEPVITVFENDTSDIPAGDACLVARHIAAVGNADVLIDGEVAVSELAPGESSGRELLEPGAIAVNVVPSGEEVEETMLDEDVELTLVEGVCSVAYVIGSPDKDNLSMILQLFTGGDSVPEGPVEAGLSGLLDSDGTFPYAFAALLGFGLVGALVATRSLATRR